jgi:AcrR family transcriptional regulator
MTPYEEPLTRLSPGPGALPRRQVAEIQRARILSAAVDTAAEVGYGAMTIAAVLGRARVSRKTFYEIFANRDECFRAVVEEIFARGYSVARAAYEAQDGWLAATRSALTSLLCLIDEEPALARTWFVDALAGPLVVHERKAQVSAMLSAAVDGGRTIASAKAQISPLTAEATVGAISHIIYTRLVNGSQEPFAELLGPCMYLIALPYLGVARANAELRRAARRRQARRPANARRRAGSLRDVNLRLTYRTVTALGTISGQPGISNRGVAEESGIKDQGQVSKLLSRLERLALVENHGLGQGRGAANAWYITARGDEVVRATSGREFIRSRGTAQPTSSPDS